MSFIDVWESIHNAYRSTVLTILAIFEIFTGIASGLVAFLGFTNLIILFILGNAFFTSGDDRQSVCLYHGHT